MDNIHHNGVLRVNSSKRQIGVWNGTPYRCKNAGMAVRIRELRRAAGLSQGELARAIGEKNYQTLQKIEKGQRRLDMGRAKKIAEVLRCSVNDLDDELTEFEETVPIVGYVGQGGEVRYFDDVGRADRADAYGLQGTVAITVQGDVLWPFCDDGDLVYYYPDDTDDPPTIYGKKAVVRLRDGRTMVKRVYAGRRAGTYRLEAFNAPPIEDVEIEWAAKVRNIHKA